MDLRPWFPPTRRYQLQNAALWLTERWENICTAFCKYESNNVNTVNFHSFFRTFSSMARVFNLHVWMCVLKFLCNFPSCKMVVFRSVWAVFDGLPFLTPHWPEAGKFIPSIGLVYSKLARRYHTNTIMTSSQMDFECLLLATEKARSGAMWCNVTDRLQQSSKVF